MNYRRSKLCCREHLFLVAEARALLDGKACGFKRMAHAEDAPGGRSSAGRGEAGEGAHELRRPHVGVLGGREAVEVERVGGEPQVARDHHVAEEEREHDSSAIELQPMGAGQEHRPARVQLRRPRELRVVIVGEPGPLP